MKGEQQPSDWPRIEARLIDEIERDAPEFPPFLHRRIMAAVRSEAEKQARPRIGLFKMWRWVVAGGLASIALALALKPAPTSQPVAETPKKVSEWIVMAANSDDQMVSLISDRVLNDMINAPYQRQLDSLGSELESALDFTLRLMPIEVALR